MGCDGFLFDAGIGLNPILSFQGPEAGRADAAVQPGSRGPAEAPDGRWQSSSSVLRQSRELIPAFPDKIDRLCHYLKRKYMGDIFGMVPMISVLFVKLCRAMVVKLFGLRVFRNVEQLFDCLLDKELPFQKAI